MKFDVLFYYDADRVLASETKEFENAAEAAQFVEHLLVEGRYYKIQMGAKTQFVPLARVAKIELIDRAMQEEKMVLDIL